MQTIHIQQPKNYLELCQQSEDMPIFMQPYWLDAVCGIGNWSVALAYDQEGKICGALTYQLVKLRGFVPAIVMPPLTPHCGIWLTLRDAEKLKQHRQYTNVKAIVTQLVAALPQVALYHQKFSPAFRDWQPFFWAGYQGQTHYTYLLHLDHMERLYAEMKGTIRTDLKKSERLVNISESEDLELLYALCKKSWARQNITQPFDLQTLTRLDLVLRERAARKIYLAKDNDGTPHAMIYIVYDHHSAHYLIGGSDSERRQSAALTALLWQAIQDAQEARKTVFNFEGSMIPSVEVAFRAFGAEQVPFFRITKAKNRFWEMMALFFRNYR